MHQKQQMGEFGEELACGFLKRKGYRIVERNYWQPWGGIDIIAVAPDKALVFVEVKSLAGDVGQNAKENLMPEGHLTGAKLQKLKKVCSGFANSHPKFLQGDKGWRIDLVAITIDRFQTDHFDVKQYEHIG